MVSRNGLDLNVIPSSAVIHHDGYRPAVLEARGKLERNRAALERAVVDEPANRVSRVQSRSRLLRPGPGRRCDAVPPGSNPPGPRGRRTLSALPPERAGDARAHAVPPGAVRGGGGCMSRSRLACAGLRDAHATLGAALAQLGSARRSRRRLRAGAGGGGVPLVATDRSTAVGAHSLRSARSGCSRSVWPEASSTSSELTN